MISVEPYLKRALGQLRSQFDKDELAYLALTSKPEFPVRDRLAFTLYRVLEPKGFHVSREWGRTDLAVLREDLPVALLEIKSMYSFDAARKSRNRSQYRQLITADVAKALKKARSETQVFALLLSTHPFAGFASGLNGVVKYLSAINSTYSSQRPGAVRETAARVVQSWSLPGPLSSHGSVAAGKAFGVRVVVDYWLIGPCSA